MNISTIDRSSQIDVVLDIRQLRLRIDERNRPARVVHDIWPELARDLVGKSIVGNQTIELSSSRGLWSMLILDPRDVTVIGENTRINVIDIEREPELRHTCKECSKTNEFVFGPFFCPECRVQNRPDRLCETHARFLENKYAAYCDEHRPRCRCREGCSDFATFECDYCHKMFSDRWKHPHPNDTLILLCSNCYSFHFERCEDCEKEGRKRLGKSRCAFPTGTENERHGKRLCTFRHARQWQIWGPHWRGIVLCEQHYQQLSHALPSEILWLLITARAPAPFLRSKVTDAYRIRNIIGYVRKQELSWAEMERVLNNLAVRASQSNSAKYVVENIHQTLNNLKQAEGNSVVEENLLRVIRDFYRVHLRSDPASVILKVSIKRMFEGRGKARTYRIAIRVGKDPRGQAMTGLLIGKRGILVEQLRNVLKAHAVEGVDFEE